MQTTPLQLVTNWKQFVVPIVIGVVYVATRADKLVWLLAAGYLLVEEWRNQGHHGTQHPATSSQSRSEFPILAGLCLTAAFLTSATVRPDADDAYFLNVAVTVKDHAIVPPQSFDALHRDGLPPVEQILHLPQTYEILIGVLSDLTGATVKGLYYVILPPIWAMLATLAHWLVLRTLLPWREALWGTAIYLFLLVTWGDGHLTFGNF